MLTLIGNIINRTRIQKRMKQKLVQTEMLLY